MYLSACQSVSEWCMKARREGGVANKRGIYGKKDGKAHPEEQTGWLWRVSL